MKPHSGSLRPPIGTSLLRVLLALSLVYYAALMLDLVLHPLAPGVDYTGSAADAERWIEALIGSGAIVLGAFIMRRVPGNRIGPLSILYGVGTASFTTRLDLGSPLFTSIAHLIYVISSNSLGFPTLFVLILSFPSGHIYPRRAVRLVTLYVILYLIVGTLVVMAQSPGGATSYGGQGLPINPLFVPALSPYYILINGTISNALGVLGLVGAAVSLILRYRAAQIRERQQIKWFVWLACVVLVLLLIDVAISIASPDSLSPNNVLASTFAILFYGLLNAFPALGIGIAILRHRLWEIDIIINRTLVYGSLTALLALLYVGLIFGLQSLLGAIFKQSNNDVAIVISTLTIAALFQPLRRRIQGIIDRRFYRKKYDAQKTLATFSATLRNEVDVDTLHDQLLAVVQETMQPSHVSLWVRKPTRTETASLQTDKSSPEEARVREEIAGHSL